MAEVRERISNVLYHGDLTDTIHNYDHITMKAAGRETRGLKTNPGIFQPATRGFMNDLIVTTSSYSQAR